MNPFTMRSKQLHLFAALLTCIIFVSCEKKTEQIETGPPLSDYLPLQVGKYITYRLDSSIFTNFGTQNATHSYEEKQVVDAKVPDASGRDSYRILRFLRDTSGTQPWTSAGTYFITPTDRTIEVIDNNLRFVKLVFPIKLDNTWKGNRYLPDEAYSSLYSFSNDFLMDDWDYTYSSVDGSLNVKGKTYNDVLTVDGIDEVWNADPKTFNVISDAIGYVNRVKDVYAKNLGLIYQEFIMWEYQPANASNPVGVKIGFGIKRSIIDHN